MNHTIPEAASLLECSVGFIYQLISLGKLKCVNGYISGKELLKYKKEITNNSEQSDYKMTLRMPRWLLEKVPPSNRRDAFKSVCESAKDEDIETFVFKELEIYDKLRERFEELKEKYESK